MKRRCLTIGIATMLALSLAGCGRSSRASKETWNSAPVNYAVKAESATNLDSFVAPSGFTESAYSAGSSLVNSDTLDDVTQTIGEGFQNANAERVGTAEHAEPSAAKDEGTALIENNGTKIAPALKLIRTVNIYINAKDGNVGGIINDLVERTASLGGYSENKAVTTEKNKTKGSVTLRIPSEEVDNFLNYISGKNYSIESIKDSSEDVTLQYTDIEARINVLEIRKENYYRYLREARNIDETMKIERELNSVTQELESLYSQIRVMSSRINYSTVNVDVSYNSYAPDSLEENWASAWSEAIEDIQLGLIEVVEMFSQGFIPIIGGVVMAVLVFKVFIMLLELFGLKKKKNSAGDKGKESLKSKIAKFIRGVKGTADASTPLGNDAINKTVRQRNYEKNMSNPTDRNNLDK